MAGGGALRTAAKFAGIGGVSGALRGVSLSPPSEHPVRNASRPVSAAVSSSSSPPQRAIAADVASPNTAASWDFEEWEVADGGELMMEGGEPMPRVVFGGVPSYQEAKDATAELKDAIDKIYLSSNSSECEGSSPGSQVSVLSPFHSELGKKSRVIEAISSPSVPKHAFQAFQLLSTSSEVQTVVASIACDQNVWNAVRQNPALQDFYLSQHTVAGSEVEATPENLRVLPDSDSGNGFVDIVNKVTLTVSEMVSSMSCYLHNIFGFSTAEKSSADADAAGNTKAHFMDHIAMGGTFMGLAVLVVMVVVLKRA